MFRDSNQFNRFAYVGLRELGNVKPIVNYFERTYAALYPAVYHGLKSTINTESEWLERLDRATVVFGFPLVETNFLNAVIAGDVDLFRIILPTINLDVLIDDDDHTELHELNPFSPFQLNYSAVINAEIWTFLKSNVHDVTILKWAVITHQPLTVFENEFQAITLRSVHANNALDDMLLYCLNSAAMLNRTDIVKFLVQNHLFLKSTPVHDDENQMKSALGSACANGNYEMVKWVVNRKNVHEFDADGMYPLQLACMSGDPKIVRLLLEHGADVHCMCPEHDTAEVDPPIIMVCRSGNLECAKILVEYGAYICDLDRTMKDTMFLDPYRQFYLLRGFHLPVFEACMAGHLDLAEYLVSRGADLNARFCPNYLRYPLDGGRSFILYAYQKSDYQLVKFLLRFGADINDRDTSMSTVVHYACKRYYDLDFISFLVEETNADWFCYDDTGFSPLDYLIEYNFDPIDIAHILHQYLTRLDTTHAFITMCADIWSHVYKNIIVKVASDSPDLLLQYALLSKQDVSEIDRIIASGASAQGHPDYKFTPYSLAALCHPTMKHKFSPAPRVPNASDSFNAGLNSFGIFHEDWVGFDSDELSLDVNERKRPRSPSMDRFGDNGNQF